MDGNAGSCRPSFFLWSFLAGFAEPWTGRLKRVLVNILLRLAPDQIHSGRLGTDAAYSAHAGVILGSAVPVAGEGLRCPEPMMHLFINSIAASAGGGLTYIRNVTPHLAARADLRVTLALGAGLRDEFCGFSNLDLLELEASPARSEERRVG